MNKKRQETNTMSDRNQILLEKVVFQKIPNRGEELNGIGYMWIGFEDGSYLASLDPNDKVKIKKLIKLLKECLGEK